jgi:hypothetical protein
VAADLGSAVVTCSLSGLLVGGAAAESMAQKSAAALEGHADAALAPVRPDTAEVDRAVGAAAASVLPLDLSEYSGLTVRAIGDGKVYTAVLRTEKSAAQGIEYHAEFVSSKKFDNVRLPFSTFYAVKKGKAVRDAPELDRANLVGMGVGFFPQKNDPATCTGQFYLSLANVKAYRKRDEPELVYISDAAVAEQAASDTEGASASEESASASEEGASRLAAKAAGERLVRKSGLTYFIVRPTSLTDAPASQRLAFTQGGMGVSGSVSREDVAEVVVSSLLDPRACNVAFTLTESKSVAPSPFSQDISKALEVLEPNK